MSNSNINHRRTIPTLLIAFGLACFLASSTARAGSSSIVGLWRVHYFAGGVEQFQSFDQWHSDGQEFEVAGITPGTECQGVFKQLANGSVKLFHVGWNYDQNGALTGFFRETQINTVDSDGDTYRGTWDIKNYDTNGNFLNEANGTLRANRLTVK